MEVNSRVNYPIKAALINLCETEKINLDDDLEKHCVSWFIINVANSGIALFLAAWNEHPIPGLTKNRFHVHAFCFVFDIVY